MVLVDAFSFFLLFVAVALASSRGGPNFEAFLKPPMDFCRTMRNERGRCVPVAWCSNLVRQREKQHQFALLELVVNKCTRIRRNYVCCPYEQNIKKETTHRPSRTTTSRPSWSSPAPIKKKPTPSRKIPKTTVSHTTTPSPELGKRTLLHRNRRLLPENNCGAAALTSNKIFGGTETAVDEFPWMVLLRYRRPDGTVVQNCAGSLINDRYVVTAAHCIWASNQLFQVRLGEHDTRTKVDCRENVCNDEVVDVDIEKSIVHPEYVPVFNDIALLRLKTPVRTTRFISPVCLPLDDLLTKSYDRQNLTVAGWGRTYHGENSPVMNPVKLKVNVPVVNLNACNQKYNKGAVGIRKTQICAGGKKGKDSCQGDSGGPLMSEELTDYEIKWYLMGIVSFGPRGCGTKKPAVYTRVSEYVTWILDNIKD